MLKDIRRVLLESKVLYPALAGISGLMVLSTLFDTVTPWFYRELVNFLTEGKLSYWFDRVIPDSEPLMTIVWIVGLYFVTDVLWTIVANFEILIEDITLHRTNTHFADITLRKLQSFSVSYFERVSPGWLRERVFEGVRAIYGILSSLIVHIMPIIVKLVVATVILLNFDFGLALSLIVAVPLYVVVTIWRAQVMRFWQKKIRTQYEKRGRYVMDNFNYFQLVKEFGKEEFEAKRVNSVQRRILKLAVEQQRRIRAIDTLRSILRSSATFWVIGYGGYLVLQQQLVIGDLVLFVSYVHLVMNPLTQIMRIYDSIVVEMVSVKRLIGIWDVKDKVADKPDAKPLKVEQGEVVFDGVSFAYHGGKRFKGERVVFEDLSFTIKPHEVVALVGPSGAGKSTIVKLLLRFYDPTKGRIIIDGQDIRNVTQSSLRKNVSAVMQDVMVMNNTVKYNLKYGKVSATDKQIHLATKIANLYDFILSLRRKFNTKVGERGVRLSGGERQRLAIARAMLKDTPILVMDEATSALDTENERAIQDAMWKLIKGRTTIIIAHRLSTVKRADRIVVIDQGKIIEQGSHTQLMKRSGYYKRLFTMQGQMLD